MLLELVPAILLSAAVMLVIGFVLLFIIYYITSPFYTLYGDRRSRVYYSMLNALYFSLLVVVFLSAVPALSNAYGALTALAIGMIAFIVLTAAHVFAIAALIRRRVIKISRKKRTSR